MDVLKKKKKPAHSKFMYLTQWRSMLLTKNDVTTSKTSWSKRQVLEQGVGRWAALGVFKIIFPSSKICFLVKIYI